MKTFICCCLTIFAVVSAQGPRGPPPGLEECKSKINPSDSDLQSFFKHEIPSTNTAACFMACMGKAMGMMNADNTLNIDKATEMASHAPQEFSAKMIEVFKTCKNKETATSDECAAAKNMATCLKTERANAGLPDMPPHPPRPQ